MSNAEATNKRDLAANRLHRILIWGVPFAALIGLNFTAELLQPNERVEIAAVLFLMDGGGVLVKRFALPSASLHDRRASISDWCCAFCHGGIRLG